jgi:L-Ala-D/L-Glu epimerase
MIRWSIAEIDLPLKFTWAISRGEWASKKNIILKIEDQETNMEALGEVAFNSRYEESIEQIREGLSSFLSAWGPKINSLEDFIALIDDLQIPPCLRFGLEATFVHYLAILFGRPVPELLGIRPKNAVETSFSIPLMDPEKLSFFLEEHHLARFCALKLKLNREMALPLTQELLRLYPGPIRLDGNECWENPDEVLTFLEAIDTQRVQMLEQPLHAEAHDAHCYLFSRSPVPIFADESLRNSDVTEYYAQRFHGINIKLMKAGGYFQALRQLKMAQALGLQTMLGCMVESSLGISSAMHIADGFDYFDLDGHLLLKEDPYHCLSEENGRLFFSYLQ